jgi:putative flippase GtrA
MLTVSASLAEMRAWPLVAHGLVTRFLINREFTFGHRNL